MEFVVEKYTGRSFGSAIEVIDHLINLGVSVDTPDAIGTVGFFDDDYGFYKEVSPEGVFICFRNKPRRKDDIKIKHKGGMTGRQVCSEISRIASLGRLR